MIVIPIHKTNEILSVASVFDKAKWFAFVKDNEIIVKEKETYSPLALKQWLLQNGVTVLIFRKITNLQYQMIKNEKDIQIFYTGYSRINLSDALIRYKNKELTKIDDNNYSSILHHF